MLLGALPQFEQDPDEVLTYGFDFGQECARIRRADETYATNTRVRPGQRNGFQYNASTGGRSGTREPRWPTTVGATVQDGSVTWTCEAVSNASLERTVSGTPAWTADTGLTVASPSVNGEIALAAISGGTLGQQYMVRCAATLSDGNVLVGAFMLRICRPARVSQDA